MSNPKLCTPDTVWVCKKCTVKNTNDVLSCLCCGARKKRFSTKQKVVEASLHAKRKREESMSKKTVTKQNKIKRTGIKQRRKWQVV